MYVSLGIRVSRVPTGLCRCFGLLSAVPSIFHSHTNIAAIPEPVHASFTSKWLFDTAPLASEKEKNTGYQWPTSKTAETGDTYALSKQQRNHDPERIQNLKTRRCACRNMGLRVLWIVRRFLQAVLGLLRRMRLSGLGLLWRVYSALLRLLGHAARGGNGARSDIKTNPRLDSKPWTPPSVGETTVCCSTLPGDYREVATGSAAQDRTKTIADERCRDDTLVDTGKQWLEEKVDANQLSPRDLCSPNPGIEEGTKVNGASSRSHGTVLSPGIPELSSTIDDLYPVGVDESERYKRGVKITKGWPKGFIIPYSTVDYPRPAVPLPWTRYVHPEGAVYFWDADRRIVTDADILNPQVYETVESRLSQIQDYIKEYHICYPSKETVHLYLEHYPSISAFGYYFVDHTKQTLFWLDTKYGYNIVRELQTPSPDLAHVGIELRSQYWYHNEYFPHIFDLPHSALLELQDLLWHAVGDLLTSSRSTIPYTLEEAKDMQVLVSEIVTYHRDSGRLDVGARTVVCRLLGLFTHERFLNFYGEKHARLCHDQSVFEETKQTWFISLVSPVLLYAPGVYLKKLQSVSVDSLVNKPSFDRLFGRLTEEWKEYTLYATVLLTSNVSFLAIQSLDESGSKGYRDPAQRASYFSTVVSIGTITLGLFLVRQHNTTLGREFHVNRSVSAIGLETLAIMYSLPYALLMYGMVTFFLAFSIMCFRSGDNATIGILSFACAVIVLLLLWCISASFENTIYETHWLGRKYRALRDAVGARFRKWGVVKETISEKENV